MNWFLAHLNCHPLALSNSADNPGQRTKSTTRFTPRAEHRPSDKQSRRGARHSPPSDREERRRNHSTQYSPPDENDRMEQPRQHQRVQASPGFYRASFDRSSQRSQFANSMRSSPNRVYRGDTTSGDEDTMIGLREAKETLSKIRRQRQELRLEREDWMFRLAEHRIRA